MQYPSAIRGFAAAILIAVVCFMWLRLAVGWHISKTHVTVAIGSCFAAVLAVDYMAQTAPPDMPCWPFLILLLDAGILLRISRTFSIAMVAIASVYLALISLERVLRFGFFDLPFAASQEYKRERLTSHLACETLPCPWDVASGFIFFAGSAVVFVGNFAATCGFSDRAAEDNASLRHTVDTVEAISRHLAAYDVDTVSDILRSTNGALPTRLHDALQTLEANLRAYRPYLPEGLFHEPAVLPGPERLAPPGGPDVEVSVVFTDIVSSTVLWELAPEAMKRAMSLHNAVLRSTMEGFAGYEVKTIGDAFMVAFASTQSGVGFCLEAQLALFDAAWPAALTDLPLCRQGTLWNGLTLRMGINSGPVTIEENVLTGRRDYYGHSVNVAARLEQACTPGAVCMRYDLWCEERDHCAPTAESSVDAVYLKNVKGRVHVVEVWPLQLAGRQRAKLSHSCGVGEVGAEELGSCVPLTPRRPAGVLGGTLRQLLCTLGVVGMGHNDASDGGLGVRLDSAVRSISTHLAQSGGSLVTLVGSSALVGWNLAVPCSSHAENSVRFARLLMANLSHLQASTGIATGLVQYGVVGSVNQRFVTVVGRPLRQCLGLSELAAREGYPCLYAALHADSMQLPEPFARQLIAIDPVADDVGSAASSLGAHNVPSSAIYQIRRDMLPA